MELLDILLQGYVIPGTEIGLDLPTFGGWFTKGIFSAIGQGMYIFIVFMVVVWVAFSLYGAFSIISSFGDPQKIEKGWKTIKSVWIGISYFLLFFVVITLVAVFIGMGAPWKWAENLQQCSVNGPAGGRFYFQGKDVEDPPGSGKFENVPVSKLMEDFKASPGGNSVSYIGVFCCETGDKQYIDVGNARNVPAGCTVNNEFVNRCLNSGQTCSPGGTACCSGNCDTDGGPLGQCR